MNEKPNNIFYSCCTVACFFFYFLDETATKLELTTAPNELLVSVCVGVWYQIKKYRQLNSRNNAANEQEEHFL